MDPSYGGKNQQAVYNLISDMWSKLSNSIYGENQGDSLNRKHLCFIVHSFSICKHLMSHNLFF